MRFVIIHKDTKNRLIKQILGELFWYMGGEFAYFQIISKTEKTPEAAQQC